jgi:hypothetical protein
MTTSDTRIETQKESLKKFAQQKLNRKNVYEREKLSDLPYAQVVETINLINI